MRQICPVVYYIFVICLFTSNVDASSASKGRFISSKRTHDKGLVLPAEDLDGRSHPCYRPCNGKPMTCFYHFKVEWYQSMSKACYKCPFNVDDCDRKDCVVANGLSRQITVINRKLPGPSIEVCQYDKIVVNLTNELGSAAAAIHWHGAHQRGTPYMDGVPFVTQCPVQPETTFTYKFTAAQAGTHFWHSHIGLQRGDGVVGALVVRKPRRIDTNSHLYDYDLSEHVIQVLDWTNRVSQTVYTEHYHSSGHTLPTTLLINGRGIYEVKNGARTATTKAARFNVSKGKRYRFRLINAEFHYCPVELTVDGHDITVIASDGHDLKPVKARSLVSYAGERFDFIINANQEIDNYWIRVRGLMNCVNSTEVRQVAVLHYHRASNDEPAGASDWEPRIRDKLQINPENQGEEQDVTTTISKLRSSHKFLPSDDTLKRKPDYQFYIAYDFYLKDNDAFNKPSLYGHEQVRAVNKSYSVVMPQLNHITMKLPNSPLLITRPPNSAFCDKSSVSENCKTTLCRCHHILPVKLNSVVEVIIIDEGKNLNANHPFHLHGHSFRVIGQKRLNESTTAEEIINMDKRGEIKRNFDNPPVKDTVTVPDGGYTIIRFKANNPGFWLFHCHIEFHAEVGMALAFKVGEYEDMEPIPQGFPTCGDYGNVGADVKDVFANVANRFNAYHSIVNMPQGGEIEIVYKPPSDH